MPEATTPNTSLLEQKLSSAARFVTPASGDYAQCISRWAENAERKAAYVVQVADDKDVQAAVSTQFLITIANSNRFSGLKINQFLLPSAAVATRPTALVPSKVD